MAALFATLLVFLALCVLESLECVVLIRFPELEQPLINHLGWVAPWLDYGELAVVAAVLGLWLALLVLCLAGSPRPVPVLKRLARKPWAMRVSLLANSVALAAMPVVLGVGVHAESLTRRCGEDAAVYFLYDEGIQVPRWGYALGLYRISLQAQRNWGKGGTVLDALNPETLRQALANGRVVILATHGEDGVAETYFAPEVLRVWPPDSGAMDETSSPRFLRMSVLGSDEKWGKTENVPVNDRLQLAYIFACNGGKKAAQWQEHLAPAQVITYNRVSTVWDHAVWFAFAGPLQLKKLR
jgi:hypothetical protein